MAISFTPVDDPAGLEIRDSIEQRHLRIQSERPLTGPSAETQQFVFPVDAACTVDTSSLLFNIRCFVFIHDEDGQCVQKLDTGDEVHFDSSTQFIGLNGPITVYCRTQSAGTISTGLNATEISFEDTAEVTLGARSHHNQPEGTIETPTDPPALMQALSLLSSALKTTSPERSWPSLRGHPPLIECADKFDAPEGLSPPSSEVTLTVPPTCSSIYAMAPLAFYLGAPMQPGSTPRLTTPSFEYPLGTDTDLEDAVATLLKHLFTLDCIVRTEGIFPIELYERTQLAAELPFDLADTYQLPVAPRVQRYLSIPFETVRPYTPDWPLTAHVQPVPESVELVPYIINELGLIRSARGTTTERSGTEATAETAFRRSTARSQGPTDPSASKTRSAVVPDPNDESLEHAWFGDEVPLGASKATIEALQAQLGQTDRSDSIDILLVCNEAQMLAEHDLLDDVYGERELLPFDIRSEFGVTTAHLESLLADGGYDFLHFIGHATPDGLECPDGALDIRTMDAVDVGVFFLNACQSYEQGIALARRGAYGGVSTLKDVVNDHAVTVGETVARLLNRGFPLRASLAIARKTTGVGDEYLIVGDGSADLAQSDDGAPMVVEVAQCSASEFEFTTHTYPTKDFKLGTATESTLRESADMHLSPRSTPPSTVSKDALEEYLTWTEVPVLVDGELHWNDSIGPVALD